MSVVSREPNKTYRDIDGNTYIATNKFPQEGFNLEWWASRSKGKPYRKEFAPLPPLHTAHDQIEAAIPEFSGAANKAIKEWLKHNLLK